MHLGDEPDRNEIDRAIFDMEMEGIHPDTADEVGLGDMVEKTLNRMGITEERFKKWFNLKECNCSKRKKWLNKVFSVKKKRDQNE
tara:strand:- start:1176 stop:1430 length:255 start_codon:yes stop_codon:yes gene_type:complete